MDGESLEGVTNGDLGAAMQLYELLPHWEASDLLLGVGITRSLSHHHPSVEKLKALKAQHYRQHGIPLGPRNIDERAQRAADVTHLVVHNPLKDNKRMTLVDAMKAIGFSDSDAKTMTPYYMRCHR